MVYKITNQVLYQLKWLYKAKKLLSSIPPSQIIAEQMHSNRSIPQIINPLSARDIYERKTRGLTSSKKLQR